MARLQVVAPNTLTGRVLLPFDAASAHILSVLLSLGPTSSHIPNVLLSIDPELAKWFVSGHHFFQLTFGKGSGFLILPPCGTVRRDDQAVDLGADHFLFH